MIRNFSSTAPGAVIMGMTANGLSFVRSLGRRGIDVLMMDAPAGNPAMRTRYGTRCAMPDVLLEPETWLSTLLETARRSVCRPVLIPTGDEYVLFVSQNSTLLKSYFHFRIPAPEVAEMLCNKRLQYQYLIENRHPMPRTAFVDDISEVPRQARDIGFPCVLKPLFSHRWRRRHTGVKLRKVTDAEQLERACCEMANIGESVLLQEYIPGGDDAFHGYLAYYGADGRRQAGFTKQKLRQWPPGSGNGSLQISTRNREVEEISERILDGLNYTGLVGIEYKRDERDGQYKVIEINPRSVSGNQLAIDCGVDLPYINFRDAVGAPSPHSGTYRTGVKFLNLAWDVQTFMTLRRRGDLTTARWIRSLTDVRSLAFFSARDPMPFLFQILFGASPWLHSLRKLRSGNHGR